MLKAYLKCILIAITGRVNVLWQEYVMHVHYTLKSVYSNTVSHTTIKKTGGERIKDKRIPLREISEIHLKKEEDNGF